MFFVFSFGFIWGYRWGHTHLILGAGKFLAHGPWWQAVIGQLGLKCWKWWVRLQDNCQGFSKLLRIISALFDSRQWQQIFLCSGIAHCCGVSVKWSDIWTVNITFVNRSDYWLARGISGYMFGLFMKKMLGNNEYRNWMIEVSIH